MLGRRGSRSSRSALVGDRATSAAAAKAPGQRRRRLGPLDRRHHHQRRPPGNLALIHHGQYRHSRQSRKRLALPSTDVPTCPGRRGYRPPVDNLCCAHRHSCPSFRARRGTASSRHGRQLSGQLTRRGGRSLTGRRSITNIGRQSRARHSKATARPTCLRRRPRHQALRRRRLWTARLSQTRRPKRRHRP